VNWDSDRSLFITHYVKDDVMLSHRDAKETTENIHSLWGHRVVLEYKNFDGSDL